MLRLTSRNVGILEPGEYRDHQVKGLILRVGDTSRAWGFRLRRTATKGGPRADARAPDRRCTRAGE